MEYEYDKWMFEVMNEGNTIKRIGEDRSYEILYMSKELKMGKYAWALRVDHHPGCYTNIISGVMTKAQKENSKFRNNLYKCTTKGSEVWSIRDNPALHNMNKTSNKLKRSDFRTTGSILYHSLDMVKGTFEIRNSSKKLVSEVKGLSTKNYLLPFVCIYFLNTQVSLIEQSFEPAN